jgi:pimeloyl-ACP methyl ester carboxylesterase
MTASPPAGNPVSASLLSRLKDEPLHNFVANWDALEQLAVAAYRDQQHDAAREARFRELLSKLLEAYPRWENALSRVLQSIFPLPRGEEQDPFARILSGSSLAVLQNDWELMRSFPQAREAINVYLLERLARGDKVAADLSNSLEHVTVDTSQVRLHVVLAGPQNGAPVVLLHGFPEFWYGWRSQIAPLAEAGFRVIVPDQRGYNLSDKPRPVRAYRMSNLTEDILAVLDHQQVQTANVVGHDWGAAVGWHLAMRHPGRVDRLAILNVPHPAVMRSHLRSSFRQLLRSWYIFFFQIPWLPDLLLRTGGLERLLQASSKRSTFSNDDLDSYRAAWRQPGAVTAMLGWYRAAMRYPREVFLDLRIPMPALILWGARDVALDLAMAEASLDHCDRGRLEVFPRATHWVHHDEAVAVNQSLIDFLKG